MLAAIIFILAFFVRFHRLDLFPLNHDEVTWTLRSINNFDRFLGLPVACFKGYIQSFFSYFVIITNKLFSDPVYIIRMPAVIIGFSTVVMLYFLAKEMYGRKTALFSAALLSFLPWHIIQSRIGVSLILTPFFGCLIFYALIRALKRKSVFWFLLSFVFLGIGSVYTYQASLSFAPLFFITLFILKKDISWVERKYILVGVLAFIVSVYPVLYLYVSGELTQYFGKVYRMYYQDPPFTGTFLEFFGKLFINFKDNIGHSFKGLFFSKGYILYGHALHAPLFITPAAFFTALVSIIIGLINRKSQDKIIVIWLILGYIIALSCVRSYASRYSIAILPPVMILIGSLTALLIESKRRILAFAGALLVSFLFFTEAMQTVSYYRKAPFNLEECRHNSYGCKETAEYLSRVPEVKDYAIMTDSSMEPLYLYLNYFLNKSADINDLYSMDRYKECKGAYYVIWAPESHPEYWRNGEFSWSWKHFKDKHPDAKPLKTIYYPNGLEAIYVFKVDSLE